MRDQNRNGGIAQHVSGYAAKQQFAEPGMAACPHDDEIGAARLCLGEDGGACLSIFAIDKDDLRFDTVARQMMCDIHD
jgi:hypothetical protein